MEQKTKIEKEVIRLQLESFNCKLERLTHKKTFYESILNLYLEKSDLIQNLIEKQKQLHIVEHRFLIEIHKYSSSRILLEEIKKNFQDMEEDLKQAEEMGSVVLKNIEESKKLLQKSEEELLAIQKKKEDF